MASGGGIAVQALPTSLLSLPAELQQIILSLLPDPVSVKSLILAHPIFRQAFLGAESLILATILTRQIGLQLIFLAEDVADAAMLIPWRRNSMGYLLDRIFLGKGYKSEFGPNYEKACQALVTAKQQRKWTLGSAVLASELHRDIEYLAMEFAMSALGEGHSPFSANEVRRIHRSFYLFELYCIAFRYRRPTELAKPGKDRRFGIRSQRYFFHQNFPPWQLEQLACVYDFLKAHITPTFEDVAQHDVDWGYQYIGWLDSASPHKEFPVSQGIASVRRLGASTSYAERYRLLSAMTASPWDPTFVLYDDAFFHATASNQLHHDCSFSDYLRNMEVGVRVEDRFMQNGEAMLKVLVDTHTGNDLLEEPDIGPFYAWQWAHQSLPDVRAYFDPNQRRLRSRGYVMWDKVRLDKRTVTFSRAWRRHIATPEEEFARGLMQQQMVTTFEERSWIFRKGGRGWWSKTDKSKVIWLRQIQWTLSQETLSRMACISIDAVSGSQSKEYT